MKDFKKMPKMAAGGCVGKYQDGGSIRVDRSPKYSDAEMAPVREQINKNAQAIDLKSNKKPGPYTGGSIRVDRSPKYANSQMASTKKQIEERAKAFKPELDKASEDYNKAIGKDKKITQPSGSTMAPFDETYKRGGKVKK